MAEFICGNCGEKGTIKFGVKGPGLVDITINFKCKQCGCPGTVYAQFKNKDDVTITLEKPNYFG